MMKRFAFYVLPALLILGCTPLASWAGTRPDPVGTHQGISGQAPKDPAVSGRIVIGEFCHVDGEDITLGSIAQIHAQPFIVQMLGALSLGRSPKPGGVRSLNRDRILSRLKNNLPRKMAVICPDLVYVKRRSQELPDSAVEDKVNTLLSEYFNGREFEVKQLRIPNTGAFPVGDLDMSAPSSPDIDKRGYLTLALDILVQGRKEETLRVRGRVAAYENIVCAARDMKKGDALTRGDIKLVKKDVFSLRGDVLRDPARVEGQALTTGVGRNKPIQPGRLTPLPLIRKGEVVSLTVNASGLSIMTSGIAREDGFRNKPLRVENLGSGKVVRGIVRGGTVVEVIY